MTRMPGAVAELAPERLFGLQGRVAIVTGGARGIGRACAEALARAGSAVLIADLVGAAQSAADLRRAGLDVIGADIDVTASASSTTLVDTAVERWGRVDTVLANAGIALDEPDRGIEEALEAVDRMFDLHVRAVLRLADAALPVMAASGGGAFLVMSSLSGLRGNRVIGGYGVTKAANAQLARNISVQWGGHGIRANALSPGVIATEFARPITDDADAAAARLAKTPLARFGTAAEVAAAVVWLASPGGAFVSGQNIVIDGGTVASD